MNIGEMKAKNKNPRSYWKSKQRFGEIPSSEGWPDEVGRGDRRFGGSIPKCFSTQLKYLLFSAFLLLSQLTFAQSVFKGKVTDEKGNAVRGVNVTLSQPNAANILAFSITDNGGNYKIEFTSDADSLQLNLYALGFAPQKKIVRNTSQQNDFTVAEQNIDLKEVIVKPDPVTRRGDTLTFNVGEFKDANDRAIIDIIKKLPGIEVEASGRILYQGKPINKYYIEGLDLLGGRYNLANENLPVDAVSGVQIVENHQPIKMLDSLEFSENAAINIQLKNKVTVTGTANVGVGALPLLWEANVTPMLFTKKNQFIGSYQANNVGNNIAKQTKILTIQDIMNNFESDDDKNDWLRIQQLAPPSFADSRWLDNNAHLASINQLKKLKNDYELRLNASYTNDYQQQAGSTTTLFYTPLDTIGIVENKYNQLYFNSLETNFSLQKNDPKKYFDNELKFRGFWDGQRGNLTRNGEALTQELSNPYFSISNKLKNVFTVGKQLLTLRSFVSFNQTPQSLSVTPGQFTNLLNAGQPFSALNQNVNVNTFQTNNTVSLTRSYKGVVLSPTLGFIVQRQQLTSELTKINSENIVLIGDDFSNDLSWLQTSAYAKLKSEYRKKDWRFTVEMPLTLYNFSIEEKISDEGQTLNRLAFEPRLSVGYEFNAFWKTNVSVRRSVNLGELENVHYGYILKSYRTIERRNAPLPINISNAFSGGLNYRNPLISTFFNVFYVNNVTENNLLISNQIDENGAIELIALEQSNKSYNQTISGRLGKYFSKLKSNASIGVSVSQTERQQLINDVLASVIYQSVRPDLKLTIDALEWFGVEYKYQLSYLKNSVENQSPQRANQQTHQAELSFYPTEQTFLGIRNEYYVNRFINQNTENLFTDLTFRYTFTKSKIDLEANWNNVFNIKTLTTVSASSFAYSESTYQLRPSQVLVKVRFSFK
ncbi:MAG: Ig-like domain-containing protein [Spirosomataceae bacterium]